MEAIFYLSLVVGRIESISLEGIKYNYVTWDDSLLRLTWEKKSVCSEGGHVLFDLSGEEQ